MRATISRQRLYQLRNIAAELCEHLMTKPHQTPEAIQLPNAKPCPFCGSARIVKGERYFAMCVDCGATGPERNADATHGKFTVDWNTRAQPSNETT